MKAYAILLLLVSVTAVAFYIVWMNRASEKIISAVLPISAAALIGIFMAVFVFGGQPATSTQFPAMFIFKSPENLPVSMPFRHFQPSLILVPLLAKKNPDVVKTNDQGATLYHHLLQKAIIDTLAMRYGSSWKANITRFDMSTGSVTQSAPAENASVPTKKITQDEMQNLLGGNKFANVRIGIVPELGLPPGTKVVILPPHDDKRLGQVGLIVLDNDFIRISIQTRLNSWGFLFGGYRLLLGQENDTKTDLRQATFEVNIKHEYKRLRTGHPEMPQYKAWAEQLTDEIQREFDEEKIWAKTKEDYAFAKQLAMPMPSNFPQAYGVLQVPEQH